MTFQEFCSKENRITSFVANGKNNYSSSNEFEKTKLSRSELKRLKAAEKETITMTKSSLEKYIQRRVDKYKDGILLSTSRMICVLWCMQLHDNNGFEVHDLEKITSKVDDLMDTVASDYVKWEELRDQLAEETGFYINLSGSK